MIRQRQVKKSTKNNRNNNAQQKQLMCNINLETQSNKDKLFLSKPRSYRQESKTKLIPTNKKQP